MRRASVETDILRQNKKNNIYYSINMKTYLRHKTCKINIKKREQWNAKTILNYKYWIKNVIGHFDSVKARIIFKLNRTAIQLSKSTEISSHKSKNLPQITVNQLVCGHQYLITQYHQVLILVPKTAFHAHRVF